MLTQTQLASVNSKIKAGALPETSGLEAETQLARDEANVVAAQNAVELSLLSLRQLLQITDEQFEIETPEVKFENTEDVGEVLFQGPE